ncbi:MAG: NAD(P)H-hydrate dehydratase [Lachnospiraceae bacterium]|nr:NAD(P)H-hydrate dehydratase [Lachnospiraceae bacterium]
MRYVTTSEEMQKIDQASIQEIGIPGMVLMEKAALKMHDIIVERFDKTKKICIIAGTGNNGGDGLALGRMLLEEEYDVTIQVVGNVLRASEQFLEQMQILLALGNQVQEEVSYEEYDILVDAIFGVGLSREVGGTYAEVLKKINQAKAYKIAVDAPSGICCTTGNVLGIAVKCDLTITFGLMKRGLLFYPGNDYAGEIIVADIGFPKYVISRLQPSAYTYGKEDLVRLPERKNDSHKGTYGKVLIVAGTTNMAGACYFSAKAAYLCGSGLVEILTTEENRVILQGIIPEAVMTTYHNKEEAVQLLKEHMNLCQTAVIGPGMGQNETTKELLEVLLKEYSGKLIVDADACNMLAGLESLLPDAKAEIVITPHMKEASRILGISIAKLKEDSIGIIQEYAGKNHLTFVLKNARTLISSGERLTFINASGNNGMSTGGSGDVLTGIIAGLCSGGMAAEDAAKLGVYCHGLAGDYAKEQKGVYSLMASDLLGHIPDVFCYKPEI